jgi:AraC-like DNA-binding protein
MANNTIRPAYYADRRLYDQIIDRYLADCYAKRTAARVSELADLLDAARPHLSTIITQMFGKSLGMILRERRLQEASRLLRVTTLSIAEVAEASAFGTVQTFYCRFRQAFGMTPGEYRRRLTDSDASKIKLTNL